MTLDEVVSALEKDFGLVRSKSTIQRFAREGLISKPHKKAAGRGRGSIADYPQTTPLEFYASFSLLAHNSVCEVAEIRQLALLLRKIVEKYKLEIVDAGEVRSLALKDLARETNNPAQFWQATVWYGMYEIGLGGTLDDVGQYIGANHPIAK